MTDGEWHEFIRTVLWWESFGILWHYIATLEYYRLQYVEKWHPQIVIFP